MEEARAELELRVLGQAVELVGQSLDLDQALAGLLRLLQRTLHTRRGSISLLDEAGGLVVRARLAPLPADAWPGVQWDPDLARRALSLGRPFCLAGSSRQPLCPDQPGAAGLEARDVTWLAAPLPWQGHPLGLLCVDRLLGPQAQPREDLEFLSRLAALAAQMAGLEGQARVRQAQCAHLSRSLREQVADSYNDFHWLGQSALVREAYQLMEKVAPSRTPVLLLGETGTGKSLAARIIHELSPRAGGPFQGLHCGGWPEEQLEAQLFGLGAPGQGGQEPAGRLELAHGGTVFLHGVNALSLPLQAKLLRLLQEGEVERPADGEIRRVDLRLIAASPHDLAQAVDRGLFREDLYYRLGVFPIPLPPLRERGQDQTLLLDYFLERLARRRGRWLELSPAARRGLLAHPWPGNLLEMANLLERLSLLAPGPLVDLAEVVPYLAGVAGRGQAALEEPSLSRLEEIERREVMAALERHNWVQSHAARELGLTLRQIGYRIKKFGLAPTIGQQRRKGSLA